MNVLCVAGSWFDNRQGWPEYHQTKESGKLFAFSIGGLSFGRLVLSTSRLLPATGERRQTRMLRKTRERTRTANVDSSQIPTQPIVD